MVVLRRGRETAEGDAVAASRAMYRSGRSSLVLVRDMRDRIQRKSEQQAGERDSQPLWRSSDQMKDAHSCRLGKPLQATE
jgi:hypothetical protein